MATNICLNFRTMAKARIAASLYGFLSGFSETLTPISDHPPWLLLMIFESKMRGEQVMLEKLLKMNVLDGDRRPQDADYSYIPSLNDELALLILARVPRSEYSKLSSVNKRYLDLLRSQYLYEIRREIGIGEPLVFMLADGEPIWRALDPRQGNCRQLPVLPSDPCFMSGDKESFCAGTDLLVSGREIDGLVIWRYELDADTWFRGPPMKSPRCLFASAGFGSVAYVAGGIGVGHARGILDTAERYDSKNKSWNPLPKMNKARKLCSGCFMDNKFYALGGKGEDGSLVCGEFYDAEKRTWELIPDMMKDTSSTSSPPLIAVVNNDLYSLDAASNKVKIYLKKSNSWKDMGEVPVRADRSKGWGVAFKSLGSELLVIGGATPSVLGHGILTVCMCRPDPDGSSLNWRFLESKHNHLSSFVFNCSVMVT